MRSDKSETKTTSNNGRNRSFTRSGQQKIISFLIKFVKFINLDGNAVKYIPIHQTISSEYNICKTPFDALFLFKPFPQILPYWFRVCDISQISSISIDKTLLGNSDSDVTNFSNVANPPSTIYINMNIDCNEGVFDILIKKNEKVMFDFHKVTNKERIMETTIVGKDKSLFKRHFPAGIDISSIGNQLFDFFDNKKEVEEHFYVSNDVDLLSVGDIFPFILLHATSQINTNGSVIPYPKESMEVNLLLDDTFDVVTLNWANVINY